MQNKGLCRSKEIYFALSIRTLLYSTKDVVANWIKIWENHGCEGMSSLDFLSDQISWHLADNRIIKTVYEDRS